MKDLKTCLTALVICLVFLHLSEGIDVLGLDSSGQPPREAVDDHQDPEENLDTLADEDPGQYFIKVMTGSSYPNEPSMEGPFVTRSEARAGASGIQEAVETHRNKDPLTDSALNIPGVPGIDYPIFKDVPRTGFHCQEQRYKGFFADMSTKCQAWHYCDFSDGQSTFLCPNGTLFSQILLTCDWWFNVNCEEAQQLYVLNESLYRYVKSPKPTFPEDYHGPEVDLWLKRQLQLGILPKIPRNKAKLSKI